MSVPESVEEFLEAYRRLLQRAIDEIWSRIRWCERVTGSGGKRVLPALPMDNTFLRELRRLLVSDWGYTKCYVDSAIRQAYMILKSWRRRFVKGGAARRTPVVRRRFARVKQRLYRYRDGRVRISIRPYEYLDIDVSRAWFWGRIPKNARMGELILGEGWLTITFKHPQHAADTGDVIAWDLNVGSMDGFTPTLGWIRVDLRWLFHIHRVYEVKRQRLQKLAARKPSIKDFMKKYSKREHNRSKDFVEKLTTEIAKRFTEYEHIFEDLDKAGMLNRGKTHNREIQKTNWKTIIRRLSDKAVVGKPIDPRYTSQQCPRCGARNTPDRQTYTCSRCRLEMDRHLLAAINVYMLFKRLEPDPSTFAELRKNVTDKPNILIDIRPKKQTVEKIINKYRRLLKTLPSVPTTSSRQPSTRPGHPWGSVEVVWCGDG